MAPIARPRDTRRTLLLAGTVALALVTAAGVWFLTRDGDALPPSTVTVLATPGDLAWRADDRRAYRLAIDSSVTLDPDGPAQGVEYALHALLCLRVTAVAPVGAEVAFQLRDVDYRFGERDDAARSNALGVPFVATFDGGIPAAFRFPAGLDGEVQAQLAEVVRTFQATLPEETTSTWNALEEHQSGRYRAVYSARPGAVWSKRKAAYVRGADVTQGGAVHGEAKVRVLHSEGALTPSRGASWWDAAEIVEELELSNSGQVVARVATRSTLQAADDAWDPTADIAAAVRTERLLQQPVPALSQDPVDEPVVEPKPATPADRARFRALVDAFAASDGNELGFVHQLAAMLREFPELAAELPPLLKDPELRTTVAAGLAHALELAGNEASQEALGDVSADPAYPIGNRLRAIVALSGVAKPTDQSIELLTWLSESRGTGPEVESRDLANTALLALGRMGNTLNAAESPRYASVAADLRHAAERSVDPNARAVALKAIANTRDADLAPAAIHALDARDAPVRAAAAQALAAIDEPSGLELLTARLTSEKDGRVRAAMVGSMREMGRHSEEAFATCANLVERERDPSARGEMARYLVDNLDRYPDGREILERLVRDETDPDTLSYVAGRLYRGGR